MARSDFIAIYGPYAQQWAEQSGIPAEVFLAIGASETNWGAAGSIFGIKGASPSGKSQRYKTWENVNGQRVYAVDDFAVYDDPNEAFQHFMGLVSNGRYAPAWQRFQKNGDWYEFLEGINKAGYATDPQWATKIANLSEGIRGEVGDMPARQTGPTQGGRPAPEQTGPGGDNPFLDDYGDNTNNPPGGADRERRLVGAGYTWVDGAGLSALWKRPDGSYVRELAALNELAKMGADKGSPDGQYDSSGQFWAWVDGRWQRDPTFDDPRKAAGYQAPKAQANPQIEVTKNGTVIAFDPATAVPRVVGRFPELAQDPAIQWQTNRVTGKLLGFNQQTGERIDTDIQVDFQGRDPNKPAPAHPNTFVSAKTGQLMTWDPNTGKVSGTGEFPDWPALSPAEKRAREQEDKREEREYSAGESATERAFRSGESATQRTFQGKESALDRAQRAMEFAENQQFAREQAALTEQERHVQRGLQGARQFSELASSIDPLALPAFYEAGGGNIMNAIASGGTGLSDRGMLGAARTLRTLEGSRITGNRGLTGSASPLATFDDGWEPHVPYSNLSPEERAAIQNRINSSWTEQVRQAAMGNPNTVRTVGYDEDNLRRAGFTTLGDRARQFVGGVGGSSVAIDRREGDVLLRPGLGSTGEERGFTGVVSPRGVNASGGAQGGGATGGGFAGIAGARSPWENQEGDFGTPLYTAAQGLQGTVTQPTLILAGENGPEDINIDPLDQPYLDRVRRMREMVKVPNVNPYDVGFGRISPTIRRSYATALQGRYGVPAEDVLFQADQYRLQGLQGRTGRLGY